MRINIHRRRKSWWHWLPTGLSILLYILSFSPAKTQTVSLQSVLSDSTFFNVRVAYAEGTVTLKSAYLTRKGNMKRTPVECTGLKYKFDKGAAVSFGFSVNFAYDKRRYTAQGRYAEAGTDDPECVLRCVPLRLSDKTLRESEYPALR